MKLNFVLQQKRNFKTMKVNTSNDFIPFNVKTICISKYKGSLVNAFLLCVFLKLMPYHSQPYFH